MYGLPEYLKRQMTLGHENVRYTCYICEHKLSSQESIKKHIEDRGIEHACIKCD